MGLTWVWELLEWKRDGGLRLGILDGITEYRVLLIGIAECNNPLRAMM